jgi:hypothetical protein
VCAGGVWLYANVRGEIGVEGDAIVERVEEYGNVVLVEERGKVAAKELVLVVAQDMADCGIAMENCALLGKDKNGDVDELGNYGIGPALLAGELEGLLLGSSSSSSRVLMLMLVLVMGVGSSGSAEGAVDRDWVLHY